MRDGGRASKPLSKVQRERKAIRSLLQPGGLSPSVLAEKPRSGGKRPLSLHWDHAEHCPAAHTDKGTQRA